MSSKVWHEKLNGQPPPLDHYTCKSYLSIVRHTITVDSKCAGTKSCQERAAQAEQLESPEVIKLPEMGGALVVPGSLPKAKHREILAVLI